MNVQAYIDSGILETYVLGLASEAEVRELLHYKAEYPQVQVALAELETDLERLAGSMAVPPPPGIWQRIEKDINEVARIPEARIVKPGNGHYYHNGTHTGANGHQFIEVEGITSHIRVHRAWRWALVAIFVLGKIFLACAIYFYLENRQAQEQIQELKTELKHFKTVP